ncbi:PTS sugar transporter subunit IIA [Fusobacterium sp.]|uniref:PTS sugar transporter subunit IIA n=1 Tax=Fusobacterium sp. TaxID=68766 RepID=UPI00261F5B32|nr:PTS sugar transporter subunit IIA [Fusobacterium sp.]
MFISGIDVRVEVLDEVKSWEEAVEIASRSLLMDQCITEKYIDEVKMNIQKECDRFLVDHNIILAHSRPNQEVKNNGLSFLKVNQGVFFPKIKEKVKLIFVISALDTKTHMAWLQKFAKIMDDLEMVEKLNEETDKMEIIKIFKDKI